MATLLYTSVERLTSVLPMVGSITDLRSADIADQFALPVESQINGALAQLYSVPLSPVPDVIRGIADDLTLYRILTRRVFTQQQLKNSTWPDRFKEAKDLLDAIAKGAVLLVTSGGVVIDADSGRAAASSDKTNYNPTFTEDDPTTWLPDSSKIDDIRSDREQSTWPPIL